LPLTHAPFAARLLFSRFRRSAQRETARHRLASMSFPISTPRDSRHEGRGGSERELPAPALVRRFVTHVDLSFDTLHADPPRMITAGSAFTTNPPTADIPCRS
jgi:hypothetical protein